MRQFSARDKIDTCGLPPVLLLSNASARLRLLQYEDVGGSTSENSEELSIRGRTGSERIQTSSKPDSWPCRMKAVDECHLHGPRGTGNARKPSLPYVPNRL